MANPFVWFDLRTADRATARAFYERLLGWETADAPMGEQTLAMVGGEQPWAAIGAPPVADGRAQWLPYVQVADVDDATARATALGGTVLHPKVEGPAGVFATIADPTGAAITLWQAKPAA